MDKYVIYKGTEGIINMLGGIAYCISWCIENNHKLLIDVKSNPHYAMNFSDFFYTKHIDVIEDYDLIDNIEYNNEIKINKLKKCVPELKIDSTRKYYIDKYLVSQSLFKWDKNSMLKIYCGNGGISRLKINKYIRIKKDILDKLFKYNLNNKYENYLAIHFRNTDIKNNIFTFYKYIDKYHNIYIASDDYNIVNQLKEKYKSKEIVSFSEPINNQNYGMHYLKENKYELVFNLLIDMYLLINSKKFIGSPNSSITRLIFYIRENKMENIFSE